MIISGGVNIYPQEIEDALILHPKVADVAVIGVPNEDLGEEVKAVVQLMPDFDESPDVAEELLAYARERVAHYKAPKSVDFEEQLPRLPTASSTSACCATATGRPHVAHRVTGQCRLRS